jgi:predicted LPLAT superfamily acyltransferase
VGSFDAFRVFGAMAGVKLRMLMYRGNLGDATRRLEELHPDYQGAVIPIGQPGTMLRVAECLSRGELVGMLADRAPDIGTYLPATMLGGAVRLPSGPPRLIAATGAPVVLFRTIRLADGAYDVTFEPFGIEPPASPTPAERDAFVRRALARYAEWLEAQCRHDPFSWFNFYDFWEELP